MYNQMIIENISKYIRLRPSESEFVISLMEKRTVARKQYLLRTGEICRYDYFIAKGCVKVCYSDEKGIECIIKFAPENWWVIDLDSFLNGKPSLFYIQTIENVELYQLSRSNYELLNRNLPQFQKFSNERWQQGFISLQQRIMQNLSMTAEERYHQFINKYPGLEQRIPLKLIASYLGITPEFLSMLRKKWATRFS